MNTRHTCFCWNYFIRKQASPSTRSSRYRHLLPILFLVVSGTESFATQQHCKILAQFADSYSLPSHGVNISGHFFLAHTAQTLEPYTPIELTSVRGNVRTGSFLGLTPTGDIRFVEDGSSKKTQTYYKEALRSARVIARKPRSDYPPYRSTSMESQYIGALQRAGIDPAKARDRAIRLMRDLDQIAIDLSEEMRQIDFGDPRNNVQVDAYLNTVFARLKDPQLLLETGYRYDSDALVTLTIGKADIKEWVTTEEQLNNLGATLGRKAQLLPGKVVPSEFNQRIDSRYFERRTPEDLNNRKIYVEQVLGTLEEHYHLVHLLLRYGGARGPDQNTSHWARSSGISHGIDHEADVFATLTERFGTLRPSWRSRYSARSFVPGSLHQVTTPGLLPLDAP